MEEVQPQPEALPKAEGEEKRPPSFFHSLAHWAPAGALQLIQEPGKCSLKELALRDPLQGGNRDFRAHGAKTSPWPFDLGISIAHPVPRIDLGSKDVSE
ncbi:hypothetical protein PAL_GLEAN10011112 [Pteropus alecto]|uniref:Uncharacterized protein n=1 Tax=Pteropus alecto TaxID=9402 RepID=L5KXC5_PTEAL|nr:hypothetical protein PAL_GLEAN10011112 [Pteropus alecto]